VRRSLNDLNERLARFSALVRSAAWGRQGPTDTSHASASVGFPEGTRLAKDSSASASNILIMSERSVATGAGSRRHRSEAWRDPLHLTD